MSEDKDFKEYLRREYQEATLLDNNERSKDDYIINAGKGLILAFRLNFEALSGVRLTKLISGMILENDKEKETLLVETRNGLKYGVPYKSVAWVKTGDRWPKGVYDEMKQGARKINDDNDIIEFGDLNDTTSELEDY